MKFIDPAKAKKGLTKSELQFLKARDLKLDGLVLANKSTRRRDMYLSPSSRTDWTLFAHELLHALFAEKGEHQRAKGWKIEPLSHAQIEKVAEPLGQFLKENLVKPPKARKPLPRQRPQVIPNKKKQNKRGKLKYDRIPEDTW